MLENDLVIIQVQPERETTPYFNSTMPLRINYFQSLSFFSAHVNTYKWKSSQERTRKQYKGSNYTHTDSRSCTYKAIWKWEVINDTWDLKTCTADQGNWGRRLILQELKKFRQEQQTDNNGGRRGRRHLLFTRTSCQTVGIGPTLGQIWNFFIFY